ncbi:hypothetical protein [Streptomyces sp. 147326]|uniref:hypothetical protein n=1 Tax=Streptomyces sp. 147326 TaxID=3074379 RepID=UPI003857564C
MGTWRELLGAAQRWDQYRAALNALRNSGNTTSFAVLARESEAIAAARPGLEFFSSGTFHGLVDAAVNKQPKWSQVESFVRVCAKAKGASDAEELVRLWADGYRRCGGDPGDHLAPAPVEPEDVAGETAEDMAAEDMAVEDTAGADPMGQTAEREEGAGAEAGAGAGRRKRFLAVAAALVGVAAIGGGVLVLQGFGDSKDDGKSAGALPHVSTPAPSAPSAPGTSASPQATAGVGAVAGGTDTAASPGPGGDAEHGTAGATGGGGNTTPAPRTSMISSPGPKPSVVDPPADSKPSRYVSRIAWSNNGGSTVVQVYADYTDSDRGRSSATGHGYDIGQDIVVLCQVVGRAVRLGDYHGPAERNGLWYRMSTSEYIPAIYVDTGHPSLPPC